MLCCHVLDKMTSVSNQVMFSPPPLRSLSDLQIYIWDQVGQPPKCHSIHLMSSALSSNRYFDQKIQTGTLTYFLVGRVILVWVACGINNSFWYSRDCGAYYDKTMYKYYWTYFVLWTQSMWAQDILEKYSNLHINS